MQTKQKSRLAILAAVALMGVSGTGFASGLGIGNTYNEGGKGGAGGNGTGVGVGVGVGHGGTGYGGQGGSGGEGGSVLGSGNSSNANKQQQGQAQSSRNANDNRSNSAASNSNSNANSGNNSDQSVTVQGDNYEARRIPVATAYAPNIAPTAVCMGTSSAGAQGVTFGISVGTSWTDDNCMLLEQVRTVAAVIGDREIAAEMMCDVKAYAAARARAGKPCGQQQGVAQAAPAPVAAQPAPQRVAAVESPAPVVAPVPPKFDVQRYRITMNGLQPM